MNSLAETMRETIATQGLLEPQDRLLVAVSGGPDSLAMLHVLWTERTRYALSSLHAAHLNHGLRGEDAAGDAEFVSTWCAERGIACTLGQADVRAVRAAGGGSTQEAARAARYAFLELTAQQVEANKIATGHTQDDQIETVLLNILRGTGMDGLRGIPYRRGPWIRPLRDAPRAATVAYCADHGLLPRQDVSNLDSSHYTRNKIRLELLPLLQESYHPSVGASLLRLAENAAGDADFLHQQAEALLVQATLERTSARLLLDARLLRTQHPALVRHVLRTAFAQMRETRLGITHDHIHKICEALAGQVRLPFGLTTPAPHCVVRVTQRRITLTTSHSPIIGG